MASSSKKNKLDLLVRVRYTNPVLPPAFPPQLVAIPSASDLARFTRADFVSEYAASLPAPMLVDSEGGMPVDMNRYEGVWVGEMEAINPSAPVPLASLHPTDRLLLDPPSITPVSHSTQAAPGAGASRVAAGSLKQTLHKPDVTWLRNTTYLQARSGAGSGGAGAGERRRLAASGSEDASGSSAVPDHSMAAQLQAIERSFYEMEHTPELATLKHPDPSKAHLTAVDSFEVLPDEATFPTGYTWVIYPERPTDADKPISDERLEATILRPQRDPNSSHKTYMEMFLPEDEGDAMDDLRRARDAPMPSAETRDGVPEDAKPCVYKYLRDFDYDGTEPQVPDGYWILSMEDGLDHSAAAASSSSPIDLAAEDAEDVADLFGEDEDDEGEAASAKQSNGVNGMSGPMTTESAAEARPDSMARRAKGVYYTPVFRRTTVRKRRIGKDEMDEKTDRWDAIQVLYEEPSAEVLELRSGFDWLTDDDWANEWLRQGEANAETLGEGDGMQPGE